TPSCNPGPPGANIPVLSVKGFGFAIPSSATICGIVVEIEKQSFFNPGVGGILFIPPTISGDAVSLLKNGVFSASKSAGSWGSPDSYTTYGNSADLWGSTWTPADINNANFEVQLKPFVPTVTISGTLMAMIDHVRITVYYNDSPTPVKLISF